MEDIVGEIKIVAGEGSAHIVVFLSAPRRELLKLGNNQVVAALAVDGAAQPVERCLSRQAEIVRCCLGCFAYQALARAVPRALQASVASPSGAPLAITGSATSRAPAA